MTIHMLSEEVINKIAAGEVIERPASVIKELMENSIDANSNYIEIDVKNYGKELIRVSDNGSGMAREDALLSIRRHATSKIANADDLFSISTLGFRGEALASISAVSRTVILTKRHDADEGVKVEIEGGNLLSSSSIGTAKGTTIEVHNLFFNTPARMKFLKQDSIELKAIADVVTRYALLYSNVAFRLTHNGHNLLSTASTSDLINNLSSVYGKDAARQMIKIDFKDNAMEIRGYISKPSLLKNDRSYQSFYVNGRYVKDETITQALYDAFHSLLFVNKHPLALLSIKLNPDSIDVNVHPSKAIIKFSQPVKVYQSVFNAIRAALRENSLITDYEVKEENTPLAKFNTMASNVVEQKAPAMPSMQDSFADKNADSMPLQNSMPPAQGLQQQAFSAITMNEIQNTLPNTKETEAALSELSTSSAAEAVLLSKLPAMKILGQIAKTYFLAETDNGLLLIDQHVVQERAYYEKFMGQMTGNSIAVQNLISPAVIEFTPAEYAIVSSNLELMSSLGFQIEEFGLNTFILRTVPSVFGRIQAKELLQDLLEELSTGEKTSIEKLKESIITRMACRASIKGGDDCSIPQFISMLKELDKCAMPWTCPHGRPIIIKFSRDEIEKMFRRKG
ncbi:MAG: DNA mismatch repair endonuclease MutL [Nanoarchaeota archaeon]